MIISYYPYVRSTTTTTGIDDYTVGSAVGVYKAFIDRVPDNTYVCYLCEDASNFELGIGLYTTGTLNLTRETILDSTTGVAIDWGAGSKEIAITYPPSTFNIISAINGLDDFSGASSNDISGNVALGLGLNHTIAGSDSWGFGNGSYIFESGCMSIGFYNTLSSINAIGIGRRGKIRVGGANITLSNGNIASTGDRQNQIGFGHLETTDATTSTLSAQMEPGSGSTGTLLLEVRVLATQLYGAGTGDSKGWKLVAMVKYTSGTPTIIGSITSTVIAESAGASAWTATLDFSAAEFVKVTGEASKTIRWACLVDALDLGYSDIGT